MLARIHTSSLILVTVFSLPFFLAPASAQVESRVHSISVTGEAQINVVPDKVLITLGVVTEDPDVTVAKRANDARSAHLIEVLRTFHVDAKDIQTDHISIEPRYDRDRNEIIVGYTVRRSLVATLRDISVFDAVLSAAINRGANLVLNVQFMTSDLRKYRDQARELAMRAAREKADALAKALDQRAGKAVSIDEQPSSWWSSYNSDWGRSNTYSQSQNVMQSASREDARPSPTGETTAPGETRVRATVQVVFQLLD